MFVHMVLGIAFGLLALAGAHAQQWPARPITFVVSNGAGSSPDIMGRLLASRLEPILRQSVVTENKPGASNVIGALSVARAAADGYRFYFATSSALSSNSFLVRNLPYDPVKDFDPVALVVQSPQFLVVHRDLPVHTLPDLIALERKNPGTLSVATDGPRNATGIITQALNLRAGTHFVPVSYPNIMNGLQDTLAGRVQVGVFPIAIVAPLIAEGGVLPIGITSRERLPAFPDVPAINDILDDFVFNGWFMLVAPHGTPPDIVTAMNAAVDRAMRDESLRAMAPKLGYAIDPTGVGSPQQAAAFRDQQLALWQKTILDLHLDPE